MSGAVSESAPLLAKTDHFEFFDIIKLALKGQSLDCLQQTGKTFTVTNKKTRHLGILPYKMTIF